MFHLGGFLVAFSESPQRDSSLVIAQHEINLDKEDFEREQRDKNQQEHSEEDENHLLWRYLIGPCQSSNG